MDRKDYLELPKNSSCPLIFILDPDDIRSLKFDKEGLALLMSQDALVTDFPLQEGHVVFDNIMQRGLNRRGAVLAQSPFDPTIYRDLLTASYDFALDKYMLFCQLSNLLGAKEVVWTFDTNSTESNKSTYHLQAETKLMPVTGDVTANDEQVELLKRRIEVHDQYDGGSPKINEATELLKKNRLVGDAAMSSLIDLRRNPSNPTKSRELKLNLTSESKHIFDIAVKLNVPEKISVGADYKKVVSNIREFVLTVYVNF